MKKRSRPMLSGSRKKWYNTISTSLKESTMKTEETMVVSAMRAGFTLIEILVAVAIILMAVSSFIPIA